jgi:hypothetical protein
MSQDQEPHPPDPVVAAMQSVLAAERASEQTLADARRQGESMVAAAREESAAIGRRTDARMAKNHTAYMQAVQDRVSEVLASSDAAEKSTDTGDQTRFAEAAQRLAAKLTSDAS